MKSSTSQCSPESEDLNAGSKEPIVLGGTQKNTAKMRGYSPALTQAMGQGGGHVPLVVKEPVIYDGYNKQMLRERGVVKTLKSNEGCATAGNLLVSGCQNSINIPAKFSGIDSRTSKITGMRLKSTPMTYQTLICSVEDFLARHSRLLERGKASKISGVQCFLRLREFLKLKDLKLYSLKTSRAYSITPKGKLLESSFKRWMNWGMKFNGWFLTANFSEFPRIGNVSLLSEVLEENVGQKYYLSKKTVKKLMGRLSAQPLTKTITKVLTITDKEHTSQSIISMEDLGRAHDSPKLAPQLEQQRVAAISPLSQTDAQLEDSFQSNAADFKGSQTIGTNSEQTKKGKLSK